MKHPILWCCHAVYYFIFALFTDVSQKQRHKCKQEKWPLDLQNCNVGQSDTIFATWGQPLMLKGKSVNVFVYASIIEVATDLGNGLLPVWWQTIAWINTDNHSTAIFFVINIDFKQYTRNKAAIFYIHSFKWKLYFDSHFAEICFQGSHEDCFTT